MERVRRRLTVLVALDVAGYSSLIHKDEARAVSEVDAIYRVLAGPSLPPYGGTLIKTMGDGALIEFESVLDAVEWTMQFQTTMAQRNSSALRPIPIRAAIVLADLIVTDTDRFGAAVGFASRMQEAAPPGGVVITHSVRWQLLGAPAALFKPAGLLTLRNVSFPVEAWMWAPPGIDLPPMNPTSAQLLAPDLEGDINPSDPRPLLIVLPFDNLTGNPALEPVVDGAVEEITATLARLRDIRVVARNTAFVYKGRALDVRGLVRQVGARYLVEGSVRGGAEKLRITAQLIDCETGAHLWAGRTDGPAADALTLQDDVATHIAGALHPVIRAAEITRAQLRTSRSTHARDLTLRAMPYFWAHRPADNTKALALLDEALAADPGYDLALGLKGWCIGQQVTYLWSDNPAQDKALALGFAERAAQGAIADPLVLTTVGATLSMLQVDQSRALMFVERALALDNTFAWAWTRHGYALAYSGRAEEGLRSLQHAIDLSPEDPVMFNAYAGIATCHFVLGQYGEAVRWTKKALHDRPGMVWANRLLATAAAHSGDLDLARAAVQRLIAAQPDLTIRHLVNAIHNLDGPQLDLYLHGLRIAGVPDDPRQEARGPGAAPPLVPDEADAAPMAGH